MKIIKNIIKYMDSTLDEAEEYYKSYLEFKDENTKFSATALEMSKAHLDLYLKWHSCIESLIAEYRSTRGEAPMEMRALWNYEHEKLTECYQELKYKVATANA